MVPQGTGLDSRLCIITLKPPGRRIVRRDRTLVIRNLNLVQFRQILLIRRRPSEVALGCVVGDCACEGLRGIFRVGLAVGLVGFYEGIGGVIGLVEVLGLDCRGAEEGITCFFAYRCRRFGVSQVSLL